MQLALCKDTIIIDSSDKKYTQIDYFHPKCIIKGTKPIHGMTKRTFPAHGKVKIQDKMFS